MTPNERAKRAMSRMAVLWTEDVADLEAAIVAEINEAVAEAQTVDRLLNESAALLGVNLSNPKCGYGVVAHTLMERVAIESNPIKGYVALLTYYDSKGRSDPGFSTITGTGSTPSEAARALHARVMEEVDAR